MQETLDLQVYALHAAGLTNEQIAKGLGLALSIVENSLARSLKKLASST